MKGKKILLAVTGSIAAYKSATLIRLLIKSGATVKVIMTPSSTAFISPLTLSTLSKHPVHTDVIDGDAWNNHVDLGLWADVMLVAPATATTLGKMAHGISDNIVTAVYLSAKCPVYIAPAMDRDMWLHPATQNNITSLLSYGNKLIDAEEGELASGLVGKGRMAEPENILARLTEDFKVLQDLGGKQILITAGPTYEALDPVRFIGNHSSGKMGIALAEACAERGAHVSLVLGPTHHSSTHEQVTTYNVNSGLEMYNQCKALHSHSDVCIFAAAVADYKPTEISEKKIKKTGDTLTLELEKTIDIALSLGKGKSASQVHIGFALETDDPEANAKRKLDKKNFDLIILNSLKDKGAGFKHDTNKITIYTKKGTKEAFPLKPKTEVAHDIINTLVKNFVK